jgi:hypothetical protein
MEVETNTQPKIISVNVSFFSFDDLGVVLKVKSSKYRITQQDVNNEDFLLSALARPTPVL